ncbi:MAG TPA: glycoside hydrolase family 3 C-terminal domain-containing protein [Chitinivibrionales bacterium]|nr:glycoside hydrolase family 3 C-terminal domain-containing protein [Chitinivibrionales bacterium]
MRWRFITAVLLGASFALGQPTTQIDTVLVTPVFLKLVDNSGGIYKYRGKVSYRIIGWAYDRFNVSVSIIKDGTGEVVPLTMTMGDIGPLTWQGEKGIHFGCQFNGAPSGTYKAKISIALSQSDTAVFIESKIASMSNGDKQTIVNGGSAAGVVGLNWRDGPYGLGGTWSFPTGLAMAATWDTAIIQEGGYFMGMCFRGFDYNVQLGPSCNLCRDSRAGRTTESYGEDPFVNGKDATASVKGVMWSTIPTLKHYCCNNVERARGFYPVHVSERGLRELYTYHFGMAAHDAGCAAIMTAYNSVNGFHNAQNHHTLTDILKNFWGLKGFVLTDWDNGGTGNASILALAGLDLPTPGTWGGGLAALVPGTISQAFFDDKARRSLWARYKTGCFNAGYARTMYKDSINSTNMYNYARRVSRECYILLKNDNNLLPLDRSNPMTIAMVGPWANQIRCGPVGSAQNCPSKHYTPPTQAVKQIGGANITVNSDYNNCDYAIVCIGPNDEGEGFDRNEVSLPDTQDQLAGKVLAAKPGHTIVWYTGGSTADTGNWNKVPAIIMSSYPGEDHAMALAEVLFGDYNPGGKVPLTFPLDSTQLPRFGVNTPWGDTGDPYEPVWEGRGYPYYDYHHLKPLFCFGYGLSYTTFAYSNLQISPNGGYPGDTFAVSVDVKNTGSVVGDEVVQLYLHDEQSAQPRRYKDLRGFRRVPLNVGETKTVTFNLVERDFEYYDTTQSNWVIEPGAVDVLVGSSSLDIRQQGTIMFY